MPEKMPTLEKRNTVYRKKESCCWMNNCASCRLGVVLHEM